MSETDTFIGQAATDLNRTKWLLWLLTYDSESGVTSTDMGLHCVYCSWGNEDFRAEPKHTKNCPIRKTRELLRDEDNPYPVESLAG